MVIAFVAATVLSARIELGRTLFHDTRLSANGTQSCATCHDPRRAFTDGRTTAIGSTGQRHTLNTMTLTNVGRNATLTWKNTRIRTLEQQAAIPLFGRKPVEMGITRAELLRRLRGDARYQQLFRDAFPNVRKPITVANALHAIAQFERTIVGSSAYDRVLAGDHAAMSAAAWRGLAVLKQRGCTSCHAGDNFSGPLRGESRPLVASNGVTRGRFRVPTLRNVELTAPYMHDGSIATLDEVLARYGVTEKEDVLAFLRALTDFATPSPPF